MFQSYYLLVITLLAAINLASVHGSNMRASARHVFKERALLSERNDVLKLHRSPPHASHTVVFAVKQLRMAELEDTLLDISNPFSENYGKHWTHAQVGEFTSNPSAAAAILEYLILKDIRIDQRTLFDEFITATASVKVWEDMLNTEFNTYAMKPETQAALNGAKDEMIIRCESYSLPVELMEHVQAVFKTVQIPDPRVDKSHKRINRVPETNSSASILSSGFVTPQLLYNYYNISSPYGSSLVSQAVYETINDALNPDDLTNFQNFFSLLVTPIAQVIGGHVDTNACNSSVYSGCIQSNLDTQYIMAVAQGTPTTYHYTDSGWDDWITDVANSPNPANVYSISYNSYEVYVSTSVKDAFNIQAIKLGVMGTTILAASGDDGVIGYANNNCGYNPMFPASSPYVTAVGGTVGPESDNPEIACTSQISPSSVGITTGGGFSNYYSAPAFQQPFIQSYFANMKGTPRQPFSGPRPYSTTGRGYPDVALLANNYIFGYDGNIVGGVDGTSASTPVFAGMISIANSQRVASGFSTLGWINPFLYQYYTQFTNDITGGTKNSCSQLKVRADGSVYNKCCKEGFFPAVGWDPSTGLGSINFDAFLAATISAGNVNTNSPSISSSIAPTVSPSITTTSAPSITSTRITTPTKPPSRLPSRALSNKPTTTPTKSPSRLPSRAPSNKPITTPTKSPSRLPSRAPSTKPTTTPTKSPTRAPSTKPTTTPTNL
jgi:tripeptidyl-peptidase-1